MCRDALEQKAKEIFMKALDYSLLDERVAYVRTSCGQDGPLLDNVEALLFAHAHPAAIFEPAVHDIESSAESASAREGPGAIIGRYKLLELIGEGGFGNVYMAEQQEPVHRKVALKIIKLGMDTRAVIARFEAERQALALMDHPNIAKVLDAGATETGRPYFVMDLVRGDPITEYCDANKLTTHDRLKLFIDVCHAVQHAHQKGIIHRDLKPSNILVTQDNWQPVPKIIDFGVAKATQQRLTEKTLFTAHRQLVGTPEYMSPEQATFGESDVDTRSDIYSLGVLLYELVVGTTPFNAAQLGSRGYDEICRVIREVDPVTPSRRLSALGTTAAGVCERRQAQPEALRKLLHGDLDWIVMKCLEKDRNRRYETASELARDIERYLANEPVQASPPSAAYHLKKFVRRNRLAVAACCAIAVGLLVGFTGVTVGLIRVSAIAQQRDASLVAQKAITEELRAESDGRLRQQYNSDMNAAIMAYDENDLERVRTLLRRYDPSAREDQQDLRGPEWYFLWNASLRTWSTEKLTVGTSYTETSALAPDRNTLALCLAYRPLTILDLRSGRLTRLAADRNGWGLYVAYSADGHTLAYPSAGATGITLSDLESRNERKISAGKRLFSIAFSPDNSQIAAGSQGDVMVWDLGRENEPLTIPVASSRIWTVKFSPDGERIVAGDHNGGLTVIDRVSATVAAHLKAHDGQLVCLAHSSDGRLLATGSHDRTVRIWDARSYKHLATLTGHTDIVRGVAFSPTNPKLLASGQRGGNGVVKIWDLDTFAERCTLHGICNGTVLYFSQDGQSLITEDNSRIAIWNGVEHYVDVVKTDGEVFNLAISTDDRFIVSLTGIGSEMGTVAVRDSTTTKLVDLPFGANEKFGAIAISPQNVLVAGDGNGRIVFHHLDRSQDKQLPALQAKVAVSALAFSPLGQILASGGASGAIEVWRAEGNAWKRAFIADTDSAHRDRVTRLAFSPDGTLLATASRDHTVKVWDAATGSLVNTFDKQPFWVTGLAFTLDGRHIASGGWGGTGAVYIWDPYTGEVQRQFEWDADSVRDLLFLSDNTLVTACGDNRVKFIDLETGEQRMRFEGHTDAVQCLAASSDGKLLVSGGRWDHCLRFWRAATEEEVSRAQW
jgi:WD40 repeat protein